MAHQQVGSIRSVIDKYKGVGAEGEVEDDFDLLAFVASTHIPDAEDEISADINVPSAVDILGAIIASQCQLSAAFRVWRACLLKRTGEKIVEVPQAQIKDATSHVASHCRLSSTFSAWWTHVRDRCSPGAAMSSPSMKMWSGPGDPYINDDVTVKVAPETLPSNADGRDDPTYNVRVDSDTTGTPTKKYPRVPNASFWTVRVSAWHRRLKRAV